MTFSYKMLDFWKMPALLLILAGFLLPDPVFSKVRFLKKYRGKPGAYEIRASLAKGKGGSGKVRAMLFVPKKVAGDAPLLVFYHGTSGNKNYYKKKVRTLRKWSARKGARLLSVQNLWGLNYRAGANGLLLSARATAEILEYMIKKKQADRDKIFTFGHSAGGMAALCTAVYRPDLITGFLMNKGNYYRSFMDECLGAYEAQLWERPRNPGRLLHQLRGATVLGGKRDAARVRYQLPQARMFISENLEIKLLNRDYPKEGHNFSYKSFKLIWELMK